MTAEQRMIGALLVDPDYTLPLIRGKISPGDFLHLADRAIFEAACSLADNGETLDVLVILRRAAEMGMRTDNQYALELMNMTATLTTVELDCGEFILEASRSKLSGIAKDAIERLESGEALHEVCSWLRNEAADMAERTSHGGLATGLDALLEFSEYRRRLESGETPAVVQTGYEKLDELLGGGLVPEGFYILAARPGSGKTTYALNIAERITVRNIPVLFVTLEMSINQLTAKRVAIESGVSSTWLMNAKDVSGDRWKKISAASAALSERPLIFNRAKGAGADDVERLATQIPGLGLVVIDYLGLMRHNEGKSLYEKVTATSGALKRLARNLGIPVLCLAQLNRESEGRMSKEPRMSDLRDSGAIEQDADGIMLLHRLPVGEAGERSPYAPVPLRLMLEKNRHGETGALDLDFYMINGRIR